MNNTLISKLTFTTNIFEMFSDIPVSILQAPFYDKSFPK